MWQRDDGPIFKKRQTQGLLVLNRPLNGVDCVRSIMTGSVRDCLLGWVTGCCWRYKSVISRCCCMMDMYLSCSRLKLSSAILCLSSSYSRSSSVVSMTFSPRRCCAAINRCSCVRRSIDFLRNSVFHFSASNLHTGAW